MNDSALPQGIKVLERGWLSANNVLFWAKDDVSIVDTGYVAHQEQTLALVKNLLKAEGLSKLDKIVNTHLHSDHCGGNALLVKDFQSDVYVPASEVLAVNSWNDNLLSFKNLGQKFVLSLAIFRAGARFRRAAWAKFCKLGDFLKVFGNFFLPFFKFWRTFGRI